jgi:hypothetical protein
LPQGFDELLDQSQVRSQPPEQEEQQQGNQNDNYQVLQIKFSAIREQAPERQLQVRLAARFFCPPAAFFTTIWQIVFAAARKRIDVPASWGRSVDAAIDTSGRQCAPMDCLSENSRNLLRESAMLGCGATTERLFQFTGNISTDEHAFTVDHFFGGSL